MLSKDQLRSNTVLPLRELFVQYALNRVQSKWKVIALNLLHLIQDVFLFLVNRITKINIKTITPTNKGSGNV